MEWASKSDELFSEIGSRIREQDAIRADLLAALEQYAAWHNDGLGGYLPPTDLLTAATAAIAKAKGEAA